MFWWKNLEQRVDFQVPVVD